MASVLQPYRRLTIKVGSALLVDGRTGRLRADWLDSLAADIADLKAEGREIVIVSSGAISLGRRILGPRGQDLHLDESQAAASVGQIALSQAWRDALNRFAITTGQILITPNITEERRYYLNARTTIRTLLGFGAIPIINENDSRRHRRNPLRRQRPPVGPRRRDDRGRLPDPFVRHRRALHGAARHPSRRHPPARRSPKSPPRSRRWPAARPATCRAAA